MFGLMNGLFGDTAPARRQASEGCWSATQERSTGQAAGLISGTLVATAMGWRPAEAVTTGDLVLTFDRGLQPVRKVVRSVHWSGPERCPQLLWPLAVPAGALGNSEALVLLPEQSVLVESDTADILFGDPFTLIQAADLEGFRGIARVHPGPQLDVIQLYFEHDEVIFAQSGALAYCPSVETADMTALLQGSTALYRTLPSDEAAMLIACLEDEDAVDGGPMPVPADAEGRVYAAAFA